MSLMSQMRNQLRQTRGALVRFPIPMLFAFAVSILLIVITHRLANTLEAPPGMFRLYVMTWTSIFGFFLFLLAALLREAITGDASRRRTLTVMIYTLAVLIFVGMFVTLRVGLSKEQITSDFLSTMMLPTQLATFYWGILLTVVVACAYVGCLGHWQDYESYLFAIVRAEVIAFAFANVLFLGIAAIFLAIHLLLGSSVPDTLYADVAWIAYAPFQAGIFLSLYPMTSGGKEKMPRTLRGLLLYVVTPLLVAYSAVLYIYFFHMLREGFAPVRFIGQLVLWYGLVLAATLFFLSWEREEAKNAMVLRLLPWVGVGPLGIFFYCMAHHVDTYGLTVLRYQGIVFGFWNFFAILYTIVKRGRDMIILPIVASLLILLVSVGPLSGYAVSERSQVHRLEELLAKNNMLKKGRIVAAKNVPSEDQRRIVDTLAYLDGHFDVKKIPFLGEDFSFDHFQEDMGFEVGMTGDEESRAINWAPYRYPLYIKDFDQAIALSSYNTDYSKGSTGGFRLVLNSEDRMMSILQKTKNKKEDTILLRLSFEEVAKKAQSLKEAGNQSLGDLSYDAKEGTVRIRFIVEELYYDPSQPDMFSIAGTLLVQEL